MSSRRDDVLKYLTSHNVATLATTGPAGPWASAVFYSSNGFTLQFLSSPTSRHARNLAEDPRCSAAIHEDYRHWSDIKGIQVEGVVHTLSGHHKDEALARYGEKFPLIRPDQAPEAIRTALERVAWYELVPERCFFIDNAQSFGQRDEIPID